MMREGGKKKERKAAAAAVCLLAAFYLTGCGASAGNTAGNQADNSQQTRNAEKPEAEAGQGSEEAMKDLAALRIRNFEKRELLQKLEPDLLQDFIHLYTCTEQFEEKCTLPVALTKEQAGLLMTLLHIECPELFQYDVSENYGVDLVDDQVIALTVPYGMDRSEYGERMEYCRVRVNDLTAQAGASENRYEQEETVYRLLCELTDYSIDGPRSGDASGVLVEGKGKCDGISLAYKWIMEELGIPCIVLPGNSRFPERNPLGHAWNLVKPGEKWRVMDVTQDSARESRESLMYPVFNSADSWLSRDYEVPQVLSALGIPACTGMEESYHAVNGCYFTGTSAKEGFIATLERAYSEGGSAQLQYETREAWESFLENQDSWADQWMEERGLFGGVSYVSLDAFQVSQIRLEIDQNSTSITALEKQITEMYSQLEAEKVRLDTEAGELNAMQERMQAIQAEAEALAAGGAGSMDEADIAQYNSLVEEYNSLLAEYRNRAAAYEQDSINYEASVEEYNRLVRTYNELIAQK